jgi:hypothetical protein
MRISKIEQFISQVSYFKKYTFEHYGSTDDNEITYDNAKILFCKILGFTNENDLLSNMPINITYRTEFHLNHFDNYFNDYLAKYFIGNFERTVMPVLINEDFIHDKRLIENKMYKHYTDDDPESVILLIDKYIKDKDEHSIALILSEIRSDNFLAEIIDFSITNNKNIAKFIINSIESNQDNKYKLFTAAISDKKCNLLVTLINDFKFSRKTFASCLLEQLKNITVSHFKMILTFTGKANINIKKNVNLIKIRQALNENIHDLKKFNILLELFDLNDLTQSQLLLLSSVKYTNFNSYLDTFRINIKSRNININIDKISDIEFSQAFFKAVKFDDWKDRIEYILSFSPDINLAFPALVNIHIIRESNSLNADIAKYLIDKGVSLNQSISRKLINQLPSTNLTLKANIPMVLKQDTFEVEGLFDLYLNSTNLKISEHDLIEILTSITKNIPLIKRYEACNIYDNKLIMNTNGVGLQLIERICLIDMRMYLNDHKDNPDINISSEDNDYQTVKRLLENSKSNKIKVSRWCLSVLSYFGSEYLSSITINDKYSDILKGIKNEEHIKKRQIT